MTKGATYTGAGATDLPRTEGRETRCTAQEEVVRNTQRSRRQFGRSGSALAEAAKTELNNANSVLLKRSNLAESSTVQPVQARTQLTKTIGFVVAALACPPGAGGQSVQVFVGLTLCGRGAARGGGPRRSLPPTPSSLLSAEEGTDAALVFGASSANTVLVIGLRVGDTWWIRTEIGLSGCSSCASFRSHVKEPHRQGGSAAPRWAEDPRRLP